MKSDHLDRILGKVEDLDTLNLTILVERLGRERKLLQTIINAIKEGILIINPDGIIEYANQAGKSILGMNEKDVGNTPLWKYIPELYDSLQIEAFERENAFITREFHIHYPESRFVRLYVVLLDRSTSQEKKILFAVIISDVTEDKLSMAERIESEKLSSIFMLAAGVAHEIANPLNSIHIHLELINRQLKKKTLSDHNIEKMQDSLLACQSEVKRLDGILDNFLRAIKPVPPEMNDVNLLSLLDEVLALQSDELRNTKIKVEIELSTTIPLILGDKNQIKQVFFNVIKNSIEAMAHGGTFKISTSVSDDYVYLRFQDSGEGIDEEMMAHIFEPYFSTKPKGHGLGLMIVQRIMRSHGGQVGIESTAGKGTCLTLKFPMKAKRLKMLDFEGE